MCSRPCSSPRDGNERGRRVWHESDEKLTCTSGGVYTVNTPKIEDRGHTRPIGDHLAGVIITISSVKLPRNILSNFRLLQA